MTANVTLDKFWEAQQSEISSMIVWPTLDGSPMYKKVIQLVHATILFAHGYAQFRVHR